MQALLELFKQAGGLKRLDRAGWLRRGIEDPESVADHSYRMALLAMFTGDRLGLDSSKMTRMALIHDLGELLIGDITPEDGVSPEEKRKMEKEAVGRLLEPLPEGEGYISLWTEFEEGESKEARIVRDLDKLEMALQALEYQERHPDKDLEEFISAADEEIETEEVQRLFDELLRG